MIRHFLEKDFESIYNLGNEITQSFSKTNNLQEIYKDKFTKILIYEKDNKVVGFLMYIELDETVDILDIIVDRNYRNQNIASCLMDFMISELKDKIKIMTLEVRKSNNEAINLYEKFGFDIINIRKNYYEKEDAYLMGRVIER